LIVVLAVVVKSVWMYSSFNNNCIGTLFECMSCFIYPINEWAHCGQDKIIQWHPKTAA
jgi:hypothetical protein